MKAKLISLLVFINSYAMQQTSNYAIRSLQKPIIERVIDDFKISYIVSYPHGTSLEPNLRKRNIIYDKILDRFCIQDEKIYVDKNTNQPFVAISVYGGPFLFYREQFNIIRNFFSIQQRL